MNKEKMKKKAGYAAVDYIKDGMHIGIGTGSTVHFFIERLIEQYRSGLKIQVICSSIDSLHRVKQGGIPLLEDPFPSSIDIAVDGADQIDTQKRMIKGGGGALLREKILANSSQEMIVIVDESKIVTSLGACFLPIEILPFAHTITITKINRLGFRGMLRKCDTQGYFQTDNGNFIYDIELSAARRGSRI